MDEASLKQGEPLLPGLPSARGKLWVLARDIHPLTPPHSCLQEPGQCVCKDGKGVVTLASVVAICCNVF